MRGLGFQGLKSTVTSRVGGISRGVKGHWQKEAPKPQTRHKTLNPQSFKFLLQKLSVTKHKTTRPQALILAVESYRVPESPKRGVTISIPLHPAVNGLGFRV